MLRRFAKLLVLAGVTAGLWILSVEFPQPQIYRLFLTFGWITGLYFFFSIFLGYLTEERIENVDVRYASQKALNILLYASSLFAVATIWIQNPQALAVAYGLIGAGVAISLQDFFRNFVGGITLFLTGLYTVGDRVQIGDSYGDVIDVGVFYTTLMEMQEWVDGDQATGRMTAVPNGSILSGPVRNYTQDNSFIWDEINLTITYESDWKKAREMVLEIAERETEELRERARKEMREMKKRYYMTERGVDPEIYVTLTDNWVNFRLRYITDVRTRREIHNQLSNEILEELEVQDDIEIASENIDVRLFEAGERYPKEKK